MNVTMRTIKYADERPLAGGQLPILDGVSILVTIRGRLRIWLESQGMTYDPVGGDNGVCGGLGFECLTEGGLRSIGFVLDRPVRRIFGPAGTKVACEG